MYNLSSKIVVASTTSTEMSVEEALEKFQIKEIILPDRDGSIGITEAGFMGSCSIKFQNGMMVSMNMLKTKTGKSIYFPNPNRVDNFLSAEERVGLKPVGNTSKGGLRPDGSEKEFASTFMPGNMLSFIHKYVNLALAEMPTHVMAKRTAVSEKSAEAVI